MYENNENHELMNTFGNHLSNYRDIACCIKNYDNEDLLKRISILHILNHIYRYFLQLNNFKQFRCKKRNDDNNIKIKEMSGNQM